MAKKSDTSSVKPLQKTRKLASGRRESVQTPSPCIQYAIYGCDSTSRAMRSVETSYTSYMKVTGWFACMLSDLHAAYVVQDGRVIVPRSKDLCTVCEDNG